MADEKNISEAKKEPDAKQDTQAAAEQKPRQPKRQQRPKAHKKAVKHEKATFDFKLFNKWDNNIEVLDPGLKGYINLEPKIIPRSAGIHRGRFHKSKMHITERLALKIMVSGHTGKKHKLTSGRFAGNYNNVLSVVEDALSLIEKKENKNPLEILVRAIENSALREEVISYQLGSIMAREAVITSPQRRVDKTLRFFAQAAYRNSFNKKKSIVSALADEILAAYKGSSDSFAMKEKDRLEREASGSR